MQNNIKMTEEQINYLKINNKPYSPYLFQYLEGDFKKYLSVLQLAAYRKLTWKDGNRVDSIFGGLYGNEE